MLRDGSQRQSEYRRGERGWRVEGRALPRDPGSFPAQDTRAVAGRGRMTARFSIPAFAACGIELEYAIVDAATLDVAPLAQRLLDAVGGAPLRTRGECDWSNEI